MATITKNFTFSAGSVISANEHNSNFNTIYNDYNGNITNANISGSAAIAASKLNLATVAQDVAFTGTLDFSESTITAQTTFADLVATTADINGGTFDGVVGGTTPAAITGTVVEAGTSLAITGTGDDGVVLTGVKDEDNMASNSATHIPTQQSVKAYVDTNTNTDFQLISAIALSTSTNSGDITISASKIYKVVITAVEPSGNATSVDLRFNSDSSALSYYNAGDGTGTTEINLTGGSNMSASGNFYCVLDISTFNRGADGAFVVGSSIYRNSGSTHAKANIQAVWLDDSSTTSFEIFTNGNGQLTGTIYLYELAIS